MRPDLNGKKPILRLQPAHKPRIALKKEVEIKAAPLNIQSGSHIARLRMQPHPPKTKPMKNTKKSLIKRCLLSE
jgi:hypothetical protein